VSVTVAGGDAWRSRHDFALRWTNPPENDRAPGVAAANKLCAAANGGCTQGEQAATSIASLLVQVPDPGVDRFDLASRRRGQRRSSDRV
jgi:hypothetical protein